METHPRHRDSKIVRITLAYDDGDDVEGVASSLVGRVEAGLARRGIVTDQAPMILAGDISAHLLAMDLVKWIRVLKDASIHVGIRWKSHEFEIYKWQTPGISEIVIVGSDGMEDCRSANVEPDDLADAIENASE